MEGDSEKRDVRRPMNAFLIFCKRHRSMVREKNPDLDNRSVTRILGDLWANLKEEEKCVYTDLAKQYKDAFMKANPDYKWHNPDKVSPSQKMAPPKHGNPKALRPEVDLLPEGSIMPGKLADPSNMGGLSMLLMAGQQNVGTRQEDSQFKIPERREPAAGTKLSDLVTGIDREPECETKMAASQKAVEDAIKRTICETALHYSEMFAVQVQHGQNTQTMASITSDGSPQNLKQISNFPNQNNQNPNNFFPSKLSLDNSIGTDRLSSNQTVKTPQDKDILTGSSAEMASFKMPTNANLLELAKTCSNALGSDKKPPLPSVYDFEKHAANDSASAKLEIKKPGAPVYKGMLAEALLDTCNRGNYTGILQKNNYGMKSNSETLAVSNISRQRLAESKTVTDGSVPNLNIKTEGNGSNTILKTVVPERSEISRILVTDVKKEEKNEEEESAMVTCGKMVVNHIIDKLYFSDLATAARKAAFDKQDKNQGRLEIPKLPEKLMTSLKPPDIQKGSNVRETSAKSDVIDKQIVQAEQNCSNSFRVVKSNSVNNFDEPDGNKHQEQTKPVAAPSKADRYVSRSLKDKILSRVMKEQSLEMPENKDGKNENTDLKTKNTEMTKGQENNNTTKEKETFAAVSEPKIETKSEIKTPVSDTQVVNRKRTISQNSNNSSIEDAEVEDRDEYHPIRKSKRRNRGQRYQELINEGIIQPSKERMAAIMHDSKSNSGEVEDFQSIDSHILPETAIRRIRKRTISESDKSRVMSVEEAKRYKTGDFDLEAHIATLPACCIENLSRKRGFARQRHSSDTCPNRKPEETEEPAIVIDMEKTVSLPPHIKIPTPEKDREPVTGSRKRKARKHSITHLLPAPAESIVMNNKAKSQKDASRKDSSSSQNSDSGQNSIQQCSSEMSPRQQIVSPGLSQKCKECAKAENHSMDLDRSCTDSDSLVDGVPSQMDSGLKVCTKVEDRSETDLNVSRNCEKNRNSDTASLHATGKVDASMASLNENGNFDCIVSSVNQKMFKHVSHTENESSKHLGDTDQCQNEKQTVLESKDQEMRENQSLNQSAVVKSCDLLKDGGILHSDDLVLGKDIRTEGKEHSNNASEQSREMVVGTTLTDSVLGKGDKDFPCQDADVQNKENVVLKDPVMSTGECDVSVKVDLVRTEVHKDKHWPGDMLKRTIEQGQITADSVNLFVVSESCDKMSSAISADATDVNFNSEVQSH